MNELMIRAVGAQGDGVAEGPVFVPLTLGGERVSVRRDGERGELLEVLDELLAVMETRFDDLAAGSDA